jgi:hypothetical protein
MSDFSPIAGERPLRGSKAICLFYYEDGSRKAQRKLYNEAPRLPVFKETPGGPLLAYPSRLLAHLESLSIAREQALAEAALRATEAPTPAKSRRQLKSRKTPARKAVSARRAAPRQGRRQSKSLEAVS